MLASMTSRNLVMAKIAMVASMRTMPATTNQTDWRMNPTVTAKLLAIKIIRNTIMVRRFGNNSFIWQRPRLRENP
jgi:hypothetical protein